MKTFPSQSSQGLTVRDVAKMVRRDDEDLEVVVNRLRNWTKEGLLEISSDKHPGSGKMRFYPNHAVVDALVLSALAAAGIPAVRVGAADTRILQFGRDAYKQFPKKEAANETIRMVIVRTERSGADSYRATALTFGTAGAKTSVAPIPPDDDEVIVMVNMSSLFRRLQKRMGED